ncbi:hypothetical protein ACXDF8_06845 [Mycolicibacterium sp. CBM1]
MTPTIAGCTGLWRRTLLVEADGSRDTGTTVVWLQGISVFADVRGAGEGFAGRLGQQGEVFEWTRLVDLQPPGPPDAGRMHWDGDTLVEIGVHADYTEHWQRDPGANGPCWGLILAAQDASAILLVVGDRFGWACQRPGASEVSLGMISGSDWRITDSTDSGRVGATLQPTRSTAGQVSVDDTSWLIEESEGSVTL